MDPSDDERESNSAGSEADSRSERENAPGASAWLRKVALDGSSSTRFPSTFHAYFTEANKASKTSSNVFSQLVAPLSQEEFHERIRSLKNPPLEERIAALAKSHVEYFPAYMAELAAGFNLLFYGFGSKRNLLNKFAQRCAKKGHVVVANAFFPNFSLKDLLASAEQMIGAPDVQNAGSGLEAQCRRILKKYSLKAESRHLFLIIHNIDGPTLRTERSKSCLAALGSHPFIHIAASVDHVLAPLIWSTTEAFGQPRDTKERVSIENSTTSGPTLLAGGFSWLWHDLTTMESYDFELAYADRSSYAGAFVGSRGRVGQANIANIASAGGAIAEGAAKHVLASVTAKAKRLFALLCTKQRLAMDTIGVESGSSVPVQPGPQVAISYELLFNAARDEFIATNDTAMQALLGEFRDHGLILSSNAADGGTALWVPLSKDALGRLASEIN